MEEKKRLTLDYRENVRLIDQILRVDESFDLIKKVVTVGSDELTFYYIDGFVDGGSLNKLMAYLLSLKSLETPLADDVCAVRHFVQDDNIYTAKYQKNLSR